MVKLARKRESPEPEFLPAAFRIGALAADHKAEDIRAYDVRGLTVMADAFVICTAQSEPQMRAIFNAVKEGTREMGLKPLHTEGASKGVWLVMDYGDVIFHVFRKEAREFYDLDGLWADAPGIPLEVEP